MKTVELSMQTADYIGLPTAGSPIVLSEFDIQLIVSLFILSLEREVWEDMSDSVWDAWEAGLSDILGRLGA
jgi:hypothetical protein